MLGFAIVVFVAMWDRNSEAASFLEKLLCNVSIFFLIVHINFKAPISLERLNYRCVFCLLCSRNVLCIGTI